MSASPGRYDLVLHPSHLWLTIHESIGHPTELDRAMGYEANYAGTSFVSLDMFDFDSTRHAFSVQDAMRMVAHHKEGVIVLLRRHDTAADILEEMSPDDAVEIRRITLINHGARARQLELTSAAELSLAPHGADRAHPAFNKMFIQTEARADLMAVSDAGAVMPERLFETALNGTVVAAFIHVDEVDDDEAGDVLVAERGVRVHRPQRRVDGAQQGDLLLAHGRGTPGPSC